MSLQHIQKNSPRLLPKPAKFEKTPPNGYRVIRKTKCGAAGAGGAGSSPIHKQASLAGRLMNRQIYTNFERNLAMIVMYVPVKFELDWSNRFRVRVRKQKCGRTDGWTEKRTKTKKRTEKRTNKQTEFHQFRKEPSYDGDLSPCEV